MCIDNMEISKIYVIRKKRTRIVLGKPQKKNKKRNGWAIKQGGGRAKGPAIKKKLGTLFSILSAMQNKIYLYIIPKYGRITLNLESLLVN